MVDVTKADVDAMLNLLRNFPADGQLRSGEHRDVGLNCVLYGLVAREEVTKPCKTCGTPRFDYGYFKITQAGRALLAFSEGR